MSLAGHVSTNRYSALKRQHHTRPVSDTLVSANVHIMVSTHPEYSKQDENRKFPVVVLFHIAQRELLISDTYLSQLTNRLTITILPLPNGLSPFSVMAATAAHQKLRHMTFGGK